MENLGYKEGSAKPSKNRQLSRVISFDPTESIPLTASSKTKPRRGSLSVQWRNDPTTDGVDDIIQTKPYPAEEFEYVEFGLTPPTESMPISIWDTFDEPNTKLNTKICGQTIRLNLTEEMKMIGGRIRLLDEIEQSVIVGDNVVRKFYKSTKGERNISFIWSAFMKRWDLLEPLLKIGADLRYSDPSGMTALHLATFSGCLSCTSYLIERGINVNIQPKWYTPLHCALFGNSSTAVRMLINYGADISIDTKKENGGEESSLHCAVRANALECVELLINEGADINSLKPNGMNSIHLAADLGLTECLAFLLDNPKSDPNIRIDKNESTALHLAADEGNFECVNLLLAKNADATLKNQRGFTALHLAARTSSFECVDLLLTNGNANPNAEDFDKRSALHATVSKSDSSFDIMEILIICGGNVNHKDINGYTALHLAALEGLTHLVELLIFYDADVTIKSKKGITALNIIGRKAPDALEMIKQKLDAAITIHQTEQQDGFSPIREIEMELDFRQFLQNSHPHEMNYLNTFVVEGQKELLEHPLCSAFLFIKWKKIRKYFLVRLGFCFITILFLTFYVLTALAHSCFNSSRGMNDDNDIPAQELCQKQSLLGNMLRHNPFVIEMQWWVLVLIICFEIIRKLYGITGYSSIRHYVSQMENICEWFVIISVFLTSYIYNNRTEFWQNHIAAFAVLLGWTNLMLMIGKLPKFGVYVAMYTTVQGEFAKLFLAYSCMLIGFTISFCVIFPSNPVFANPIMGFISVLVMMVGEINLSMITNEPDGTDPHVLLEISAQITFIMFLLFVTIILMNLLCGIAVDDIQALKKTAELSKLVRQTELMTYIESALFKPVLPKWLTKILLYTALVSPQANYRAVLLVKPLNADEKRLPQELLQSAYAVAKENTNLTTSKRTKSMEFEMNNDDTVEENHMNTLNTKIVENNAQEISSLCSEVKDLKLILSENQLIIDELFMFWEREI